MRSSSADLAPSTKTLLKDHGYFGFEDQVDHNMHFGIREHAMGAIANGMSLHGGTIPYTATFMIFYDYMRPPIRLGALMGIRVIYIFTHDSIGVGEDGPTHQPIEQLMGMRLVPNLVTLRPADATDSPSTKPTELTNTRPYNFGSSQRLTPRRLYFMAIHYNTESHTDSYGFRGSYCSGSWQKSARAGDIGSHCFIAIMGIIRCSAGGLSQQSITTNHNCSNFYRGWCPTGMGKVCRLGRYRYWLSQIWHFCAGLHSL